MEGEAVGKDAAGALPPRRARRDGRTGRAGTASRPGRPAGGPPLPEDVGPWRGGAAAVASAVLDAAFRIALGAACLFLLAWLLRRGPLVAPISLFSAAGSQNGFFSASHLLAAMACAGGAAGLWAVLSRRAAAPGLPLALALALPLGGLALATGHAVYPHDARYDLAIAGAMALFYAALVTAVGARGGTVPALAALAGAGVWLAVQGLLQFAAHQPSPAAWTGPAFAAAIPVRISATLHNPNALAAALLLSIGGAGALAVGCRSVILRGLGWLALLPLAAALPLTFSRGAYLGLAVATVAAAILLPRGRRLRGLVALAAVALAVGAVAYKVPGVLFRAHAISVQAGGDVQSRFFTWRDALSVWRTSPRLGVGPGGLQALFAAHQPPGGTGTYVLIDVPGSADNDLVQWLAETGWAGAAALGAGLLAGIWGVARALRRRGADAAAAGAVLAACLLGVAVQGMFEVTAYLLPIEAMGALALAGLTGAAGLARPARPAGLGRILGAGALAAAVFTASALWAGWAPQRAFANGWALVQAGTPAAALPLLREAAALDPSSERNAAALGDAAVQAAYAASQQDAPGLEAEARGQLGAALHLDPFDGDAWAAAAALLRADGTGPAAACAQQAALKDFPYSPWYATLLGNDLAGLGQAGASRADLAYAARLFPLQLAVYREYQEQGQPYYQQAEADLQRGLSAWGSAPLPVRPVLPLDEGTCSAALAGAGYPADAYSRAMLGR